MAAHSRIRLSLLLAMGCLLAGCKDTKISSYRVPKESDSNAGSAQPAASAASTNTNEQAAAARGQPGSGQAADAALPPGHPSVEGMPTAGDAGSSMASTPVPAATDQPLVWTAPAAWTAKQGSSVRRGSYAVSGAEGSGDISITAFPGDVGGNLANVNRWRGQLQLAPVPDLTGALQPLDANGLHMLIFEGSNQGTRMIGVIVPQSGATWFFKFTGPDALVAREKTAFIEFLKTVRAP